MQSGDPSLGRRFYVFLMSGIWPKSRTDSVPRRQEIGLKLGIAEGKSR